MDVIGDLRSGKIESEVAREVNLAAKQIIKSAEVDVKFAVVSGQLENFKNSFLQAPK